MSIGMSLDIGKCASNINHVLRWQLTSGFFTRAVFYSSHAYLQLLCILQEVRKYLKECIQIFSYEPTCIQEGRLAAIARLDLVELETYVDSVEKTE